MSRPHRSRTRRVTGPAATTLALVSLLVTGCSDDGGDAAPGEGGEEPSGADAQPFRPTSLDQCTTDPTASDGLTDPGQVLCFGTPAVLPVDEALGGTGTMRLTVTGLERGDDAVIDRVITSGYPDWTSQSRDLWYAHARGEMLSEDEPGSLDQDPMTAVSGLRTADGTPGESGLVFPFDECPSTTFEDGGDKPFETCTWSVLPPGTDAYAFSWADGGEYLGSPVVWSAD